jgi:hypothetical protein
MSPIRSSDALIRRALTTMRRSRATGCWRARIWMASSSSSAASVDLVVVRDHGLGECDIGLVEGLRGVLDRIGDEVGDLDEAILHLSKLLLEHLAHGTILSISGRGRQAPHQHVAGARLTYGVRRLNVTRNSLRVVRSDPAGVDAAP